MLLGMKYDELENPPDPLLPLSSFKITTSCPVALYATSHQPVRPSKPNIRCGGARCILIEKLLGTKLLFPMGCVKLGELNSVQLPSVGEKLQINYPISRNPWEVKILGLVQ